MDDIDKKIEQDKLKKSVIKYWNVNYSVEQKKIESQALEKDSKAEPDKTESGRDMNYNPTTNARSGDYGKQPVKAEHADVIDSILDEKKFDLDKILNDPDVQEKMEIHQDAALTAEEKLMREKEELAAQTMQRVQSTDASAKAAAAVEEAMSASRAAAEVVASANVSVKAAAAVEEAKAAARTAEEGTETS